MVGQQNIIEMRMRGIKPSVVWVELLPMMAYVKRYTQTPSGSVTVIMDDKDLINPDVLDLRFLNGIQNVYVNGPDGDITEKIGEMCHQAGAGVVQAFRYDISNPHQIDVVRGTRYSKDGVKSVWQQ